MLLHSYQHKLLIEILVRRFRHYQIMIVLYYTDFLTLGWLYIKRNISLRIEFQLRNLSLQLWISLRVVLHFIKIKI